MGPGLQFALALLPTATVLVLLVVMGRSAKLSMLVAYAVTAAVALLLWGMAPEKVLGTSVNRLITAISLLYIVFGAISSSTRWRRAARPGPFAAASPASPPTGACRRSSSLGRSVPSSRARWASAPAY